MRTTRTNVTLPDALLKEIDRHAGTRRRSAFLAEAAREKLTRLGFQRVAAQAFGAWKDVDHPDLMTEADLKRYRASLRAASRRRIRQRAGRG